MSDADGIYMLRNADTAPYYYQLVSAGADIGIGYKVDSTSSKWYLTYDTPYEGYFRLHTIANGDTSSLDVFNDEGTSSTGLRFYETGDHTGQFWTLDQWNDGTYKLTNNFTGPNAYLDLNIKSLIPYLNSGVGQAPSWEFTEPDSQSISAVTVTVTLPPQASRTSMLASIATTTPTTASTTASTTVSTATPSSSTFEISPSHGKSIPLGAIIGIVIGSLAALTLCVCAVIYVLRRKRARSAPTSADQYDDPPELVSGPPNYASATSEKAPVSTHVAPQGKQGQDDQEWRNMPSEEIADTAAHHP